MKALTFRPSLTMDWKRAREIGRVVWRVTVEGTKSLLKFVGAAIFVTLGALMLMESWHSILLPDAEVLRHAMTMHNATHHAPDAPLPTVYTQRRTYLVMLIAGFGWAMGGLWLARNWVETFPLRKYFSN